MDGERHQPHTTVGIESLDGFHQADIAFLDQVRVRQTIAEIAPRDCNDQPQVGEYERTRCLDITFGTVALGKILLFRFGEQREPVGCRNIRIQATKRGRHRKR
jgi:hypothetical protein